MNDSLEAFYLAIIALRRGRPLDALDRVLAATVNLVSATSAHALFFEANRGGILRRDCCAGAIDTTLALKLAERAIAAGKVIRWRVEGHEIVCASIEAPHPLGALYVSARSLSERECRRVEMAAREIGAIAERFTIGSRPTLAQAMKAFRESYVRDAIERHGGNVSSAARELGVHRGLMYEYGAPPRRRVRRRSRAV
jgi:hypothetical protein